MVAAIWCEKLTSLAGDRPRSGRPPGLADGHVRNHRMGLRKRNSSRPVPGKWHVEALSWRKRHAGRHRTGAPDGNPATGSGRGPAQCHCPENAVARPAQNPATSFVSAGPGSRSRALHGRASAPFWARRRSDGALQAIDELSRSALRGSIPLPRGQELTGDPVDESHCTNDLEGPAVLISTGPVLHGQTFEQNPVGYLPWMIPSGVISAFRSGLTAKECHQQPERHQIAPSYACSRTRAPSSPQASAVELMREIPLQLLAPVVPGTAYLVPPGPPPVGVDRPLPGRPPLPPAPDPPRSALSLRRLISPRSRNASLLW